MCDEKSVYVWIEKPICERMGIEDQPDLDTTRPKIDMYDLITSTIFHFNGKT